MSAKSAKEARRLIKEFAIKTPPVDVEGIAKLMGISVNYERLDNEVSGLVLFEKGRARVAINRSHHRNRQRFTLAHEIGHVRLHAKGEDRVFVDKRFFRNEASSKGELREEIEANAFAASLLMPECFIRKHIDSEDGITDLEVFRMATKFEVSEQAMTLRLVRLNLIEPD